MPPEHPDPHGDEDVPCDKCGRLLAEPASRALGLGPVCRRAVRPAPVSPGQLSIPIPLLTDDT